MATERLLPSVLWWRRRRKKPNAFCMVLCCTFGAHSCISLNYVSQTHHSNGSSSSCDGGSGGGVWKQFQQQQYCRECKRPRQVARYMSLLHTSRANFITSLFIDSIPLKASRSKLSGHILGHDGCCRYCYRLPCYCRCSPCKCCC